MSLLHIASTLFFVAVLAYTILAMIKTLTGEWK
jgi:hypothetical protein